MISSGPARCASRFDFPTPQDRDERDEADAENDRHLVNASVSPVPRKIRHLVYHAWGYRLRAYDGILGATDA